MHAIFNSRKQWRGKAFALNLPLKCERWGNSTPEQFFLKQSWKCLLENMCGLRGGIQLGWSRVGFYDRRKFFLFSFYLIDSILQIEI